MKENGWCNSVWVLSGESTYQGITTYLGLYNQSGFPALSRSDSRTSWSVKPTNKNKCAQQGCHHNNMFDHNR